METKFGATAAVFSIFTILLSTATASAASEFDNMILIPAGEFRAGADPRVATEECGKYYKKGCQAFWFRHESPVHPVFLDAFYIDKYETTQLDFKRVMGREAPMFTGGNLPVIMVSWNEANDYCARVGKRLPTEMEWEKAAKGGRDTLYPWGDAAESGKANFCDRKCQDSGNVEQFDDGFAELAPVGSFPPNGYGLFDMAGNVSEWVADWYREDYYKESPRNNPKGPGEAMTKVYRGGRYGSPPYELRSANRERQPPKERMSDVGFRCAATPGSAVKSASTPAQTPVPSPAPAVSSPQQTASPSATRIPGKVVRWSSQYDEREWAAGNVLDGKIGQGSGWSSKGLERTPLYPQELIVQLDSPSSIGRVEINPFSVEGQPNWVKDVSILTGDSPDGPWNLAGRYTLSQENRFQPLTFGAKAGRFVMIRVESNWGGPFAQMGEVSIYGLEGGAQTTPSLQGGQKPMAERPSGSSSLPPPAVIPRTASPATAMPPVSSQGHKVARWTSQFNGNSWAARNLTDGQTGPDHEWSSAPNSPPVPQEIVIQLAKPAKISKIEINPSSSDVNKTRWTKQVGLYYGNTPDGPWNGVARRELEQKNEFQSFEFLFPFEASYVLVRVESNWGGNYTHMSEIRISGEAVSGQ